MCSLSLCVFLCMFRLPQQTRSSEVYKAPSEKSMKRIQTSEMQPLIYSSLHASHFNPVPAAAKHKRHFTELHVSIVQ